MKNVFVYISGRAYDWPIIPLLSLFVTLKILPLVLYL